MYDYTDSTYQEIEKTNDPSIKEKYWKTGFGLNQIDGLKPSEYLMKNLLPDHLAGKLSFDEVEESLIRYYNTIQDIDSAQDERECDLVSTRIANLLDQNGFVLSPATLIGIHRFLFDNILPTSWVGKFRQNNISKVEPILNGESVSYANYFMIQDTLQYDFDPEKEKIYSAMDDKDMVENISKFTSSIWQVHPFREGNTRTVAVFLIQYMNSMGIKCDLQPFENNSLYFRNALVRANYSNLEKKIDNNNEYINQFFEKLLIGGKYELNNDEMWFG